MQMVIQPLHKWPEKNTSSREGSKFKATWSQTMTLLERELEMVHARNVILQTMHSPEDLRLDGRLRSDSRSPSHPGVVLTFEKYVGWDVETKQSTYVALRFPCDTYVQWKENVRAIALALEALRKIDRYGVKTGSQYAGFKALPGADIGVNGLTPELAADFIAKAAGMGNVPSIGASIIQNSVFADSVYRAAAKALHPDRGGDSSEFAKLENAMRLVRELQKEVGQ